MGVGEACGASAAGHQRGISPYVGARPLLTAGSAFAIENPGSDIPDQPTDARGGERTVAWV